MSAEYVILVALEDMATTGVVAAGAAHVALEKDASRIILLHILDHHVVANGLAGIVGARTPVVETEEEGMAILRFGEATIKAEYGAVDRPVPEMVRMLGDGRAGPTIAMAAGDVGATALVVGARRPHALGRLTHPDVADYLRLHANLPVHVVALQAEIKGAAAQSV